MKRLSISLVVALVPLSAVAQRSRSKLPETLFVDSDRGRDKNNGSRSRPFKTISAAIALLPETLTRSITIEVRGVHQSTGEHDAMRPGSLTLMRRTRPGVVVRIIGRRDKKDQIPVLDWSGSRPLVEVRDGEWRLENFQVGTNQARGQSEGIEVHGPALITLKDLRIRTCSHSGGGIIARRGGRILLRGAIRLNEHLHESAGDNTFCGIIATDHGVVKFAERKNASLDIGNGSLSSSYYGCVRLGCATARITSWGRQSNCLAVNNSGRVDLHGTDTTLCAKVHENTPIGPEHDGHILAEDAVIKIVGSNNCAIALQKSSTLTCNDIVLEGEFRKSLWVMSGSMFVGRFLTDVGKIETHTGASVHIEACKGEIRGPVVAKSGSVVSLPGGRVVRSESK